MGLSAHLIRRARSAARERKLVYGLQTPPSISHVLDLGVEDLRPALLFRFILYVYGGALLLRFRLLWHSLSDQDTPKRRHLIEQLKNQLSERLAEPTSRVSIGYFERRIYSRDVAVLPGFIEKLLYRSTPHLIVQPRNENDIVATLQFASEHALAVFPRGVSSSPLGQALPTHNGLVVDVSRMNQILSLNHSTQQVCIQPGIRWSELDAWLEPYKLKARTSPSSRFSTVGGWISTGGLGIGSFKYGPLGQAIVSIKIVLPSGHVFTLQSGDQEFEDVLGSEGQLGIITEVTLALRPTPRFHSTRLLSFPDFKKASSFTETLIEKGITPVHLVLYDRGRMAEENQVFADRTKKTRPLLLERDCLFAAFDDVEQEKAFDSVVQNTETAQMEAAHLAEYIWSERFFPLKGQRIGPNLLAAEALLSPEASTLLLEDARSLARHFSIPIALEAIAVCAGTEPHFVVIISFSADAKHSINYLLRLLFVQLLNRLAKRRGGVLYGVGVWNTPWAQLDSKASRPAKLRERKEQWDPHGIMNPGKFFAVRSRFLGIPGLLFSPGLFALSIEFAALFTPLLGWLCSLTNPAGAHHWHVPESSEGDGVPLLTQTGQRCTYCGACVSVCPAYVLTGDELVTGRAKLRLGEALLRGTSVSESEVFRPFQCLRCGLCEEVCQTRLPLLSCYDSLEDAVSKRYGRWPEETVTPFIELVDEKRDWISKTFGLDLADWSPSKLTAGLAGSKRRAKGGST